MKKRIVITGGGTGGHVFPALALAEELQKRGFDILYIGSDRGLEKRLAPEKGIRFLPVRTGPVKNQTLLRRIKTVFQLLGAVLWSLKRLLQERPAAVIGVGGYISVPVCVAAYLLRIPIFLQEQNVSVGIANRFLGRLSRKVFLGFPEAARFFRPGKTVVTGNPIRKEFFRDVPYNPNGKMLLVLGGSQGARSINQVLSHHLDRLPSDLRVIHQTGIQDEAEVRAAYASKFSGKAQVSAFIDNVHDLISEATIVVSRSGAITVSELVQMGRPCLLVPFPRQGQNDQTDNAHWVASHGGAVVVEQGDGFTDRFWGAWKAIFQPERLKKMAESFSALRRPPAIVSICDQIENELRSRALNVQ